jgi:hypothetical protein
VVFLACLWLSAAFLVRNDYVRERAKEPPPAVRSLCALGQETWTPDSLCFFSPATLTALAASYGAEAARVYAWTELTLDVVFPVAYALLFLLALTWAVSRAFAPTSPLQRAAVVLPLGAAAADIVENIAFAIVFTAHPRAGAVVPWLAVVANAVKWLALDAALVLLIVALVRWALRPEAAAPVPR